jgi:hypothetical protein
MRPCGGAGAVRSELQGVEAGKRRPGGRRRRNWEAIVAPGVAEVVAGFLGLTSFMKLWKA